MRIVVSDTSCMIDLRKADLLEALLRLPNSFAMPDTLFEDEWLCLSLAQKRTLGDLGLVVRTGILISTHASSSTTALRWCWLKKSRTGSC